MLAKKNRVVVTGVGVVAPNGIGKRLFWDSLKTGRSGIKHITLFDTKDHACKIAGEIRSFDVSKYMGKPINTKRLARHSQLALAATALAFQDSGLEENQIASDCSIPLFLGVSSSAVDVLEHGMERMIRKGPKGVPTHIVHGSQPQQVASVITEHFPFLKESLTFSTACAAGLDAIGAGMARIKDGKADVVVVGGADAPINPLAMAIFSKGRMLSEENENPEIASRPFDATRKAGVISEGAGIVILENLDHALGRGAKVYLEIMGYASSMDPSGSVICSGLKDSMRFALSNAMKSTNDVEYICAHGPSDRIIDRVESEMIKEVFGEKAYSIPVSSIKGVTGNPLSAAGPLQLIACCQMFEHNVISPTANLNQPDEGCDLDYVPNHYRYGEIHCALINSHGLGGGNSSLIVVNAECR